MMGSVDELPSAPKEKTKFIEDMTEEDAAAAVSTQGVPLINYVTMLDTSFFFNY